MKIQDTGESIQLNLDTHSPTIQGAMRPELPIDSAVQFLDSVAGAAVSRARVQWPQLPPPPSAAWFFNSWTPQTEIVNPLRRRRKSCASPLIARIVLSQPAPDTATCLQRGNSRKKQGRLYLFALLPVQRLHQAQ